MSQKRRTFVKSCFGSLTFSLYVGTASAKNDERISIRRDKSNPISVFELEELKDSFANDVLSARDVSSEFALTKRSSFGNRDRKIVAYNLEMVNGTPREFIGTMADDRVRQVRMHENHSGHSGDPGLSDEEMVSAVHRMADKDQKDAQLERQTITTNGYDIDSDSWHDWKEIGKSKSYNTDSKGNTFGWTVSFKNNPVDGNVYGLETEARMDPAANNPSTKYWYRNRTTDFEHDWKTHSTVESDMFDHEPESQGVGTQTWELSANIGLAPSLTIGTAETISEGGVDIFDKSSPDRGEYAKSQFGYTASQTRKGYAEVNAASVAQILQDFDRNPSTAVQVDLEGVFDSPGDPLEPVAKQPYTISLSYDIFPNDGVR